MTDVKALLGELRASDPKFDEAQAVVDLVRGSGDLLERMRERQGWSQAELADRLGVTTARVSQLESGTLRNAPSLKMMARFARECGESVELVASGDAASMAQSDVAPAIALADLMRELAALRKEVWELRSTLSVRESPEVAEPAGEAKASGWHAGFVGEVEIVESSATTSEELAEMDMGRVTVKPIRTLRWPKPGLSKVQKAEE